MAKASFQSRRGLRAARSISPLTTPTSFCKTLEYALMVKVAEGPSFLSNDELLALARETCWTSKRAPSSRLRQRLDRFVSARVQRLCLEHRPGRVVVTGMGKSGHISGKDCRDACQHRNTAFFMHPAEASHGDLGMITKHDLLLAISYSGETDEVVTILPLVKRMGAQLIR